MWEYFKKCAAKRTFKRKQSEEAIVQVSKKLSMMREQLTIHMIDIERICPSLPHVVHTDERGIGDLCESIIRYGLLQPLTVRRVCKDGAAFGGIFTLVCGYRRFEALKKLGVKKAPCIIVDLPAAAAPFASLSSKFTVTAADFFDALQKTKELAAESGENVEDVLKKLTVDGNSRKALEACVIYDEEERTLLRKIRSYNMIENVGARLPRGLRKEFLKKLYKDLNDTAKEYERSAYGVKRQIICRDVTPMENSVDKMVRTIRNTGIDATWTSVETDEGYELVIKIPKYSCQNVKTTGKTEELNRG